MESWLFSCFSDFTWNYILWVWSIKICLFDSFSTTQFGFFSKYLQHYWKTQSGSTFFASSAVSLKTFKKIKIPNLTSKFVFKIKMDPPLAINFTRSKFARGLRAAFRANKAHFSNWRNDNLWADYLRLIIQWEYNVEGKYYFKISWNL